jgi:hypothetical protein
MRTVVTPSGERPWTLKPGKIRQFLDRMAGGLLFVSQKSISVALALLGE